jgi:hypothetical protein
VTGGVAHGDSRRPSTAVLLVHGIGDQAKGSTVQKFLIGLNKTLLTPVAYECDPDQVRAVVRVGERTIAVREVWWADVFCGDVVAGTFRARDLNAIAWFPWLNRRFDVAAGGGPSGAVAWTILVAPLTCLLQIVGWVLAVVASGLGRVLAVVAGGLGWVLPDGFGNPRRFLDTFLADVTNYTASAAHAAGADSPIASAADAVQQRFVDAANEVVADGASRLIVVAHSLGTLIAYHGISGVLSARNSNSTPILDDAVTRRIDTLITIGSPLEKIRWVWPMLTGPAADLRKRAPALRWTNLRDRLDLVSGKLRHRDTWGEVGDVALFGRAWLKEAHTAYERNPDFVRILAAELGYPAAPVLPLPWRHRVVLFARSIGYSLGAIVAIVLVVGVALVLAMLGGLILTVVVAIQSSTDAGQLGQRSAYESGRLTLYTAPVLIALAVLVLPIIYGRVVASYQHYAFRYGEWPAHPKQALTSETKVAGDKGTPDSASADGQSDPGAGTIGAGMRWRGRLGCAASALGYLALSYPVGVITTPIVFDMQYQEQLNPTEPEWIPSGHSPGVIAIEIIVGLLVLPAIGAVVGIVGMAGWSLFRGLPTAAHTYRQRVLETTRPPTPSAVAADRSDEE